MRRVNFDDWMMSRYPLLIFPPNEKGHVITALHTIKYTYCWSKRIIMKIHCNDRKFPNFKGTIHFNFPF